MQEPAGERALALFFDLLQRATLAGAERARGALSWLPGCSRPR